MSLPSRLPLRAGRALLAAALAAVGLTCRDQSLTGPGLPQNTRFSVAPSFQVVDGGPSIRLARAHLTLGEYPTDAPLVVDELHDFPAAGDLAIELTVPLTQPSQRFVLRLAGITADGDTLYRLLDTITVRQGSEVQELPVTLGYAGPDTIVAALSVSPRDTTIVVGDTLFMRVAGMRADESPVGRFLVGWTARDSSRIHVDRATGRLTSTGAGTTWIVASTAAGVRDSTRVTAFVPVARVVISPDSALAVPGDSIAFAAATFDRFGATLTGRQVAWAALDTNVAVSATGRVAARSPGVGRVVASSEGRADTARVIVGQPVPTTLDVAGDSIAVVRTRTASLSALVRDSHGTPIPGAAITWTSRRPTVATVDSLGVVTALRADSSAWIVAQSGAARDSIKVGVLRLGVATVDVAPQEASLTVGDTLALAATPRDSAGQPNFDHPVAWSSSDTTKARVSPTGVVTARDSGSVQLTATSGGVAGTTSLFVQLVPVASVRIAPDTLYTVPGDSAPISVVARDAADRVLAGRQATWQVLDSTVAVRLASGFVRGMREGATPIVATIDGVSDTALVIVGTPATVITHVTVVPDLDTLRAIGDTVALTAQAFFDATPVAATFAWASRDSLVASVDAAGRVVARANGQAWVVASASGHADSALVVVEQRATSLALLPPTTIRFLGATFSYVLDARDARGNTVTGLRAAWSTRSGGAIVSVDSTGLATAAGLGTDTVSAVAAGLTATAIVEVRSAIASIAVTLSADTARVAGQRVTAFAAARDSAGGSLSGITFQFALSDTSVARIDSTFADRVVLLAKNNGAVSVVATAQGVSSPPRQLVVSRGIASVVVTPGSLTLAVGGAQPLIAEARDGGGTAIPGVAFTWASDATGIATVDASGIAHGVAPGTAHVTATAGGVISAPVTVTVSAARISFAAGDTLLVGAPGTTAIPVLLTAAPSQPVVVRLFVNDTIATLDTDTLTFNVGVTQRTVTLSAHRAGVVRIIAMLPISVVDGPPTDPGPLYQPDTLIVVQQAALHLSQSFELNVGDTATAQVVLASPAPAGGTVVSFGYDQQGIVHVVEDSVTVPEGFLSVPVHVAALAAGSTLVRPSAGGVPGIASPAIVSAASFRIANDYWADSTLFIGQGQQESQHFRIWLPNRSTSPVQVSLATRTGAASVDTSVTVPAGQYYASFTLTGIALGQDTLIATSTGWGGARSRVVVTTPRLHLCCTDSLALDGSVVSGVVTMSDSLGIPHERATALAVSLVSRDPAVLAVSTPTVTLAAGEGLTTAPRYVAQGVGQTWIVATAPGHPTDSASYVVAPPALYIGSSSGTTETVGVGQQIDLFPYVYTDNNVGSTVTVRARTGDPSVAIVEDSVATISSGSSYAYFQRTIGVAPGATRVVVSANGFRSDSIDLRVTTPYLQLQVPDSFAVNDSGRVVIVVPADSLGQQHSSVNTIALTFASLDTNVVALSRTQDSIRAGNNRNTNYPILLPRGVGTARIVVSGGGWRPDTQVVAVTATRLSFSQDSATMGVNQRPWGNPLYLYNNIGGLPSSGPTRTFTITNLDPAVITAPASVTLGNGGSVAIPYTAIGQGRGRLIASGNGFTPDTFVVTVTPPRFVLPGLDSIMDFGQRVPVGIFFRDTLSDLDHISTTALAVRVISSDTTVLRLDSATYHVVANSPYFSPQATAVGTGTAYVTATDSSGQYISGSTRVVRVVTPRLFFAQGFYTVGTRQHLHPGSAQVCRPVVTASPLTVSLSSSAASVVQPTSTVTILASEPCANFDLFGQSAPGSVVVSANATGHQAATVTVEVGRPRLLVLTSGIGYIGQDSGTVSIYPTDHYGQSRLPSESVTLTLGSDDPSVAAWSTGTSIVLPADSGTLTTAVRYLAPGITMLRATDARNTAYSYAAAAPVPLTVEAPQLSLESGPYTVGIGQRSTYEYVVLPFYASSDVTVSLTSTAPGVAQPVLSQVVVPAGENYAYFELDGVAAGTAAIVATAPGFRPDTSEVSVSRGALELYVDGSVVALGSQVGFYVSLTDSLGNSRVATAPTTFTLSANANVSFVGENGTTPITSVTIAAGESFAWFSVRGESLGQATVTIANVAYRPTTQVLTVVSGSALVQAAATPAPGRPSADAVVDAPTRTRAP